MIGNNSDINPVECFKLIRSRFTEILCTKKNWKKLHMPLFYILLNRLPYNKNVKYGENKNIKKNICLVTSTSSITLKMAPKKIELCQIFFILI